MNPSRPPLAPRAWLAAALALACSAGWPQARTTELSWTGQPRSYDVVAEPYLVTGWGAARFGMTVDEVTALIRTSQPAPDVLREDTDPVQRTRVLTLVVPGQAPGPGPATINYVFGASSQRLAAINIAWVLEGNPDAAQRAQLLAAGTRAVAGLVGYQWAPLATARGHVVAPGAVILFAGRDPQGAGIEVRVDGVALELQRPLSASGQVAEPERRSAPPGPARLRIAVAAQPDRPDVYRLPPGQF